MATKSLAFSSGEDEEDTAAAAATATATAASAATATAAAAASETLPSSTDDDDSSSSASSSSDNTAVKPLAGEPEDKEEENEDEEEEDTSSASSAGHPPLRHSARVADPSIKPLATIPMDTTIHRHRPSSKTLHPLPPSSEDKQRQLRVWSEDDEIAILRGLADYRDNHGGTVPSSLSHMDAFLDSIRGSLRTDEVKKTQLADKVRRLKNKYEAAAAQGGKRQSFPRPHDRILYDLSRKVWGSNSERKKKMGVLITEDANDGGKSAAGKKTKEEDAEEEEEEEEEDAPSSEDEDRNDNDFTKVVVKKGSYPFLTDAISRMGSHFLTGGDAVKRALELVDPATALALEERCKKLRLMETQSHVRRVGMISEAVKLAAEALEKDG